ncbi:MAG TPA: TRC40/GET3/ArsA family transport-energizing ATPase [Vicinamibacterales bacterium]|nr:TRC40/GET3/ArsA family transport-energizing ATPase [Vicinamibacterales bacterium]
MWYGGKGGVGKTTCAAGRAVAEAERGRRVLVASTDPAHSLGDAMGTRLPARGATVRAGRGTVRAIELDAPRALGRWLARHRPALGEAIEHGTWLDRAEAEDLLELPLPGLDEFAALLEMLRLAEQAQVDLVVVDAAPTGHMLRLLEAPASVAALADRLDDLQAEHRTIRRRFGADRPDAADRLIALVAADAARVRARLIDRTRTTVEWVLVPEALALEESADALATLRRAKIHVSGIVVNRVLPGGPPCAVCDRRRRAEQRVLRRATRIAGKAPVRIVTEQTVEPRGMPALARVGRRLIARRTAIAPIVRRPPSVRRSPAIGGRLVAAESLPALGDARLVFVGGKGGVGKTTVAAAAALRLARAYPSARVRLLSTDPAHSLGDVFRAPAGNRWRRVRGAPANLLVRELDAGAALKAARADLERAIAELAGGDPSVAGLVALAPPGIDELFGVLAVMEAAGGARGRDRLIVDTAPTGHALRLLRMPDVARDWVDALLRLLLKYRAVARPGPLAERLVALSQAVRRLSTLMRDAGEARALIVTRPAELPRREALRLIEQLRSLGLAVGAVVLNAVAAGGRCPICAGGDAARRASLRALRGACGGRGDCVIIQAPLVAPPPRGAAALERWGGRWFR